MSETKLIKSPKEMTDLIQKIVEEAKQKQGLDLNGVQAQQIIAKSYKSNK